MKEGSFPFPSSCSRNFDVVESSCRVYVYPWNLFTIAVMLLPWVLVFFKYVYTLPLTQGQKAQIVPQNRIMLGLLRHVTPCYTSRSQKKKKQEHIR